jgi:hypothetical protein
MPLQNIWTGASAVFPEALVFSVCAWIDTQTIRARARITDPYFWALSARNTRQPRHAAWHIEAVIQARALSLFQ